MEEQLAVEQNESISSAKLLDMEQRKITQIKAKIAKIQEGFEAGIYTTDEAKMRIGSYQSTIARAEKEIERLHQSAGSRLNGGTLYSLRQELGALAGKNLGGATFEERQDIISKLDVKIYPSEDLKTMRVRCGINLTCQHDVDDAGAQCGKIILAPPKRTKTRTPHQFRPSSSWLGRVFSVTFIWPPAKDKAEAR